MVIKVVDVLGLSVLVDYVDMAKQAGVEIELAQNLCSLKESTEDDIIKAIGDSDVAIGQALFQPYSRKVLSGCSNLKLLVSAGVGYDRLDVEAATELGIMAANMPDLYIEEVSDHTMGLILACTRRICQVNNIVKTIGWADQPDPYIGNEIWPKMSKLGGSTIGLIGFGRIPRVLVPKAKGFGMRIIAYDPYVSPDLFKQHEVEQVDLDTLLTESDVVSVHAPKTKETVNMLSLEQFKKMKPTACLVNTARGAVIDHDALYTALSEGLISAAAVDVTEPEPINPDNPLLKLDNFLVTAHSAAYSQHFNPGLSLRPGEEIIRMAKGEWPIGLVNPDVKEKYQQKWK